MIKNKRGIIILVISLIIVYVAISIISIIPRGKKYSSTVFLDSLTKVTIKDGNIRVYNEDEKITKQNIKLYFKGSFKDCYIISKEVPSTGVGNNYFAYNKNSENLIPESTLIAHTPDISIKVKEDTKRESTDIDEISNFIETSDIAISSNYDLDYLIVNTLDIDDDGKDEYIYSVGLIKYDDEEDAEENEEETQEYISIVYLEKDGKYITIDKIESDGDPVSNIKLSFAKLIDFNNDDNYEFVIEEMMSEYGPYYYELYSFGSNKFTKIGGE